MRRIAWIGLVVVLASGCTSDIVSTGNGEFIISKSGTAWSAGGSELAGLYQQANAFCAKKGQVVEKVSEQAEDGRVGKNASATLRFRCVASHS